MAAPAIALGLAARLAGGRAISGRLLANGVVQSLIGDKEIDELENIEVPVSSSCIRSIGYRGDDVITVTFIRGGTYSYDGDKATFAAFVAAPSKGEFFNAHFNRR